MEVEDRTEFEAENPASLRLTVGRGTLPPASTDMLTGWRPR